MKRLINYVLFAAFLGGFGFHSQAQIAGKAAGLVKSNETKMTCIFAKVIISNSSGVIKNLKTDMDGKFKVSGLDTGTYNLTIIYPKHDTLRTTIHIVQSTEELKENIYNLDPKTKVLSTAKVTGGGFKSSAMGLNERKNDPGLKDIITAETIKNTPGTSNAGDVLKRLSGASIQNNKFAVIRGLSDRYNFALINGAPLPSSEADKKAFSFDMFPSSQLESMSINKTATPDMPSEFSGGVISVQTKGIPLKPLFSIGFNLGYHNLTTFQNFLTYDGGKFDFIGIDDGTRALPEGTPDPLEYRQSSKDEKAEYTKAFNPNFAASQVQALPNIGFNINLAKPFKLAKKDAGFNFSTVYKRNYNFVNTLNKNYDGEVLVTDYDDGLHTTTTFIGSMLNFTVKLNGSNKLSFKTLVNVNTRDQVIDRQGKNWDSEEDIRAVALFYQQNTLISSQLVGKHAFGKVGNHVFDWNVGYSRINKIVPDFRRIRYRRAFGAEDSIPFNFAPTAQPNLGIGGRFFSELVEDVYSANGDYLLKNIFENKEVASFTNFKSGFFVQQRVREFNARNFGYIKYSTRNFDVDDTQDENSILQADNIGRGGFIQEENTNPSESYDGLSSLGAAYAMFDQTIRRDLRIVYGARAEVFNQQLNSFKGQDAINVNTTKFDILPSMNITYKFNEETNIRVAASRTLSRPEFRELAPFTFYDFARQIEVGGNPDLQRTSIINLDLRAEHYFAGNQLVSASIFYKNFDNPIEQVTGSDITTGTINTSFENALGAVNYGFEIELKRNLSFLLDNPKAQYKNWKNYFYIFGNYAWIRSEVDVTNIPGAALRPLQGQSPYVINGGVSYNNPDKLISGGVSVNRVGKRIVFVGVDVAPDLYENPRTVIDAQLSMRMATKGKWERLTLKLQGMDFLSQNILIYQNLNMDHTDYVQGESLEFRVTNPGRRAKLSLTYSF